MKRVASMCLLLGVLGSFGGCGLARSNINGNSEYQEKIAADARCKVITLLGVPPKEQVDYLKKMAANGNEVCQVSLGIMYQTGRGVPRNYQKARSIYESLGGRYPESYTLLGLMEEKGLGSEIDYQKARAFYELAYRAGQIDGAARYAQLLADGKGGEQDEHRAMSVLFERVKGYNDDAWKVIRSLKTRGVAMNAEQAEIYEKIWVKGLADSLSNVFRKHTKDVVALRKEVSSVQVVQLDMRFDQEMSGPHITIAESSGDPRHDSIVAGIVNEVKMEDLPLFPAGKTYRIIRRNFVIAPELVEKDKSGRDF